MMHPRLRYIGGAFIRSRMRRLAARFDSDTKDPRRVQERVLRDLLALNGDSQFARDHSFRSIRTVDEFRRQVPIADYEYYRPYIERLKQGDERALLGRRNRLMMFTLSSGTTSESKFIPVTRRFLNDYRRGWTIWGIRAFDDHPALHVGDIVQLSSDHDQFRTPGGHPCGNISGLVSALQSPVVKTMYTIPDIVSKIGQADAKYYTALRCSIPNARVALVMTANPSTLLHLARLGDQHCEELIRDIADGTLSSAFEIDQPIRAKLRRRLGRRNPARARELEQVVARTGHLFPRDYWPAAALLAIWTGGSAGAYVHYLREFYGDVSIRDHGLSASEGRMTIPFADASPSGVLDVVTHFFEFIPEAEYNSDDPTVLGAHELQEGQNYYILLTTSSGLCRYDIRDVVRCTGFCGQTPCLEFLNKGAHISSITGEKISESQVVGAVTRAVTEMNLPLSYFTLVPAWGDPPGYRLLVERDDIPATAAVTRLVRSTDEWLQQLNCEYGEKRRTGRLAPIEAELLPAGTWQRFARSRQSRLGGSIEQYKHPCLIPDLQFHTQFLSEFAGRTSAIAAGA